MDKFDLIVIGSGPGGYVAAIRAAQLGKRVAVVERAETGGVCLNWGCIPTKALLKSAAVYHYCSDAARYGVAVTGDTSPVLDQMVERSRGVADTMQKGVTFLLKKNNVELIQGFGKLLGDGRVDVDGTTYEADHVILATGARPREMAFMPIDGEHVISSKQALTLAKLPTDMIVVGSGAIGSEFAYFYASIGVKVMIVEYLSNLMPLEDEEVSKTMERAFRKLRANVMTSTTVKEVKVVDGRCHVEVEGKKGADTLTADVVLSAVGIKSNIENIGLEELGVRTDRDKIVVDEWYRTSVPGVYAIGDIVPGPALAHVASTEAICCVNHIFAPAEAHPVNYNVIPSCIFTSPEVASVGMTEAQARERGMEVSIGRFPFTASGKATAAGDRDGFVKLIFDAASKKLLGAHLVGANVTEMLAEPTLAMTLGATAQQIAHTIHAHPTLNEGIMEAAEQALGQAIHL